MDDIVPIANNQFWFNHDIFKVQSYCMPLIEGKVTIEVARTTMWKVNIGEDNFENMNAKELFAFLAQANEEYKWETIEETNKAVLWDRFNAGATHGLFRTIDPDIQTLVTLHEGSSFDYGYKVADEEGYSVSGVKAEWRDGGWDIESNDGGRDCDGEIMNTTEHRVLFPSLMIEDTKHEVYDQYAEMAGY